jgi:UDP-N-acetylglucosamine 2-epimerase (non-hydrolysing)
MKIINVVGARPNFMKIAPIMDAMAKSKKINPILLHTGQHYDEKMSDLFFNELQIPKPDIYLGVGSLSHAKQVARIMELFDDICINEKPDGVLVVGDVNSTMACSLVAAKYGIKIIHVEAGLRSFDRNMPEEINRLVTDSIADLLLTPSADADENLLREGVAPDKIEMVGNVMIDTLYKFMPKFEHSRILEQMGLEPKGYVLVTLHRPSNVDEKNSLENILNVFTEISKKAKVVFPIHPRTLKNIKQFGLEEKINKMEKLILCEPLGYIDFQRLMSKSGLVITDSGGVQEETTVLGIPCITVRENTERPVTISRGSNELTGNNYEKITSLATDAFNGKWKKCEIPELWDGKASERIVKVLESRL